MGQSLVIIDNREGLTPVALTGEQPIAQAVGDGSLADSCRFQPGGHLFDGLVDAQPIETEGAPLLLGGFG